jgi:DNA-binding response OmpR family regulator
MNGSDATLLIVDDDALTRFALKRLMGRRGWTIVTAATVSEGLESLGSAPDCVILDLNLPDGNGERVLRQIREGGLTARVVVNTATTDEITLESVRRLGPDAVVHKPVEMKQLLEACSA